VTDRSNVAAIVSGMRQAKAYRVKKDAALGVLACFDLRKTKADLLTYAAAVKAQTRYFDPQMSMTMLPLYGLPEDAQEEVATA
jgi:hypothetical protein